MAKLRIPNQRAIIDRRVLAAELGEAVAAAGRDAKAARPAIVAVLKSALGAGRAEIAARLEAKPAAGHECAGGQSFLVDQLVRLIHDHVTQHVYPPSNRSTAERLTIIAAGGYGRREMAPHSDVDIAFLTPARATPWCEQVVEAMLYFLWDLGLKVGQSSRTLDETIRLAKEDLTIRTSLLEARYVWGDRDLHEEAVRRFARDVVQGNEQGFVRQKLAERNARHGRMGDSRYVVEPNVKDGKGGLRDLQTLYWIGKFIHQARTASELVDVGLLTKAEYRSFRRAEGFLLAVRCHLHILTGRAEDRLTFDLQRAVAERMNFVDRPGKSKVERFMQFYFLQAKRVGSLTGMFLTQLDHQFARKRGLLAQLMDRMRDIDGYRVSEGKIAVPDDDWFRDDPVRLVEIFKLAEEHGLEIHPETMRLADRDSALIKGAVRKDARANALFLELLCGRGDPETALRWMNEAGVFGRFVPDFGRVNAQMQFDMYHHYTVDEHTIRAIGLTSRIERGELPGDHPRATRIIHQVASRRATYVAVLLHDIAKGRGGDHSVLGEQVARKLCPRFGLSASETDLVAWLVRRHLLMSATAFKRDLTDPKTIDDFLSEVQSMERLRQLAILTAVDIRAVGPGVWNSWKGQLLGELYDAAQERLRLGHRRDGRERRIAIKQVEVAALLGPDEPLMGEYGALFADSYWVAESAEIISSNIVQYAAARTLNEDLSIHCKYDAERGATLVSVIAADHPGLFFRLAGGIHLAGANIIDARIHTIRSGYAVDNFLVQDPLGASFEEPAQLERIKRSIRDALHHRGQLVPRLAARPLPRSRAKAFDVDPRVTINNKASNHYTVIEVNARDRSALLNRLARALFENRLIVHSAHITAYGERVTDTFYVTDLIGQKVVNEARLEAAERALLDGASDATQAQLEEA